MAAEAKRVVDRRQVTTRQVAHLGGDVDTKIRFRVVQVDGGRNLAVIQGKQGGE